MQRKVFRTGNSIVVSLPREVLDALHIGEGSDVSLEVDEAQRRLIIMPSEPPSAEIDEEYARQVSQFIERYRPALEALAR